MLKVPSHTNTMYNVTNICQADTYSQINMYATVAL